MTDTLAERVEALSGPCRETDGDVADALRLPPADLARCSSRRGFWYRQVADADFDTWEAPTYTASLDAVAALIGEKLPGWAWKVGTCCVSDDGWVVPDFNCPVHGERLRKQFGDFAAGSPEDTGIDIDRRPSGNPALALLEAFLRGYALHLATLRATEKTDDR